MWKHQHLLLAALTLAVPSAQPDERFFDSDGVRIRFTVQGQGEAVVLLHGFATSLDMMGGLVASLSKDYRVIAMDVRGHGKSGKPHDPEQYGTRMVEDVVRLLDHLEIEGAHVVGYSMGGAIGLKLITTHPDRVLSAVVGAWGWHRVQEKIGEDLMERVADSLERGEGFGPLFDVLAPSRPEPDPERVAAATRHVLAQNDVRALAAAARGFRYLVPTQAALRANSVPTLAIVGESDGLRPEVEGLKGVLSRLELVIVSGTDHMSTFTSPDFLAGVKSFLSAHRAQREPVPAGR
jgi:pimeloyl-ACP methyl ester carboxylesterase